MMVTFAELSKHPVKFLAMTGYTVIEFLALLPSFQARFQAHIETHTIRGKTRSKRRYTVYKNSPLSTIEDMLLFILIYLKQGTIQEVHANLFGMYQPDANVWIHLLHPILNQALADLGMLPAREAESFDPEGEGELYLFHDGTERPIPRPKHKEAQKAYYSGKKNAIPSKTSWSVTQRARFSSSVRLARARNTTRRPLTKQAMRFPTDSDYFKIPASRASLVMVLPSSSPRRSHGVRN